MQIETTDSHDERTFILSDEMVTSSISDLEKTIYEFIKNDERNVVIDLVNIYKIDSMSLATLIRIKNKLTENHRKMVLVNPSDGVMRVLELAGLESFLLG
jgi:anti-anti-sigma factor